MTDLTEKTVLSKADDIPFRLIEGEAVLVNASTQEVIHLNDSGTVVWESLDGKKDVGEIVRRVIEEFDIDEPTARADVFEFASDLMKKGLITVSLSEGDPA